MTDVGEFVDRLIEHWRGDDDLDERWRSVSQDLTARLLRTVPAADFAAMRADPSGRRRLIERAVATEIARTGLYRNMKVGLPEGQGGGGDQVGERTVWTGSGAGRERPGPISTASDVSSVAPAGGGIVQTVTGGGINVVGGPVIPFGGSQRSPGQGAGAKIRLLFLSANPPDGGPLRLDHEVRGIDLALRQSDLGSDFDFIQKFAVRPSDLQGHLLRHRPHILHFSGHGSPRREIFLEADDGTSRPVEGSRLARLLAQFNKRLRLVVLNACYSESQASAIAEHVDCVIGMSCEVLDQAAIRIAANLYQALAYGRSVRAAFELCRADIEVGEMGQDEILRLVAIRGDPEEVRFVEASEDD